MAKGTKMSWQETEIMDKLFLEMSQFTHVTTKKENLLNRFLFHVQGICLAKDITPEIKIRNIKKEIKETEKYLEEKE
jgi:hypothetical protein